MENVNENAGRTASGKPGPAAPLTPTGNGNDDSSIWEELRSRRVKASRRIGEGWGRVSESAKDYADGHSIGVALGSLGLGLAIGLLIGIVAAKA